MKQIKLLSIVVPCYRQERTIYKNLLSLEKTFANLNIQYEIIVVIDGKVDKTYEEVKKIKSNSIQVFEYEENQGKGYAVRYGMLKAKGDVVGFIDAGMDIDPTEISIMLDIMDWNKADIIIGSKLHPESKVNYPVARKILSWGYRSFTHLLFGFKIKDTQVGIKLFKRKVVEDVFPRLLVKQFAFDVEILAVAYSRGFTRIYEAPVKLDFKGSSTITSGNFWKVIVHMLWDTIAVYYRLKITHYYDRIQK